MPEYLSPGVYIEETSYRAQSIEGVATSTAGFVGLTAFGPPAASRGGATDPIVLGTPQLVTSFAAYKSLFGDLTGDGSAVGATPEAAINAFAHSVRAFFDNGGRRVYIARVVSGGAPATVTLNDPFRLEARQPGNTSGLRVRIIGTRSANLNNGGVLSGVRAGDLVELPTTATNPGVITSGTLPAAGTVHVVKFDTTGVLRLYRPGDADVVTLEASAVAHRITLNVSVEGPTGVGSWSGLSTAPASPSFINTALGPDAPIQVVGTAALQEGNAEELLFALLPTTDANPPANISMLEGTRPATNVNARTTVVAAPQGGSNGSLPTLAIFREALDTLASIDDIAIVAAPGLSSLPEGGALAGQAVRDAVLTHCETLRYRFAIVSVASDASIREVRDRRGQHDSEYGALYYPWVRIGDPNRDGTLIVPPDGFMAGIYGRTDTERGVHKAPANEKLRGAIGLAADISTGQQDVLNPQGINCLRFFEGRGYQVWGARTLSSNPEWRYVNVRRLFIYLEHSIDRATQWVVFEPNNEASWTKVRLTIELFLAEVWQTGALMGLKPAAAFFVRCDRTTMTQSDLDNGRLICLIGVSPTKPAEFVIFRIGQWTAEASTL